MTDKKWIKKHGQDGQAGLNIQMYEYTITIKKEGLQGDITQKELPFYAINDHEAIITAQHFYNSLDKKERSQIIDFDVNKVYDKAPTIDNYEQFQEAKKELENEI